MRCSILIMVGLLFSGSASAQTTNIAICGSSEGHGYYHHAGLVKKKDAGWVKEKISNGKTVLKHLGKNEFDILVVDASGSIWSAKQDGSTVIPLRKTQSEIAILHITIKKVIEVYNFYKEKDGSLKFDLLQNKSGDWLIPKSSVLTGSCSSINF
jgi:hypothetical protein